MSNSKPTLHIRIMSPQQLILEADALSITSKNSQGSFDILPQHANFITLIEKSPIIVRKVGQKDLVFNFPLAILINRSNKVDIYTYVSDTVGKERSAYIQSQNSK